MGTGIFIQPSVVLALAGSKGASLILWLFGCLVAWAGYVVDKSDSSITTANILPLSLTVYLEYGIRFPLTGGELYYVSDILVLPVSAGF